MAGAADSWLMPHRLLARAFEALPGPQRHVREWFVGPLLEVLPIILDSRYVIAGIQALLMQPKVSVVALKA